MLLNIFWLRKADGVPKGIDGWQQSSQGQRMKKSREALPAFKAMQWQHCECFHMTDKHQHFPHKRVNRVVTFNLDFPFLPLPVHPISGER
jgi:hypothetical protein